MTLDRTRFQMLVDYLAAGVVVSLPSSASATSILAALWLVAVALTLDSGALRQVGEMPVAVLPIALVALALGGMSWADVVWPERLYGAEPYLKLLVIPLLLVHFRRTGRGELVLTAFFTSACVLLAFSWLLAVIPGFPWPAK
jgi:O-antigen ligase